MQGGLLLVVQTREYPPRLDHSSVGIDVELRRIRNEIKITLLRREHIHVLKECGLDLFEDHLRGCRVIHVEMRGVADCRFVDEREVRQVEEIVDDELPVRFDVEIGGLCPPSSDRPASGSR